MSFFNKIIPPRARANAGPNGPASAARSASKPPAFSSRELQAIRAERVEILAHFEQTARLGHVPADALIGRLYANHCAELGEDRRQLVCLEQALEGHLHCLDARFPEPPPLEPEKPVPLPGRRFGPLSEAWAKPGAQIRH